jgi:hypothetical protein
MKAAVPAALLGLLLGGCTVLQGGSSGGRVFAVDRQGAAAHCTVPGRLSPADGKEVDASMQRSAGAGWCGIPLARGGEPFAAGLVAQRPAHGTVYVHTVGDDTRIDYSPDAAFHGQDAFTVQLLPGRATVRVAVIVAG